MNKKNAKHRQPKASPSYEAPSPPSGKNWWPEEFAPPWVAVTIAATVLLLGVVLFGLAYLDRLLWVKIIVGWLIGLYNPAAVSLPCWDVAIVFWGIAAMLGATIVHPSLGLAVLLIFRPWLDGYTYPADNAYFVWGAILLAALCAARTALRGTPIRGRMPLVLLGGFLLIAWLTGFGSIQYARTYQQLLLWFGYFCLFFAALQSLQKPKHMAVVFIGLAVSMTVQALFAILHFEFLLPYLRHMLMTSRELRIEYFGVDEFNPEYIRRFNINRAFGSLLFPNALAAFLILGIPGCFSGAVLGWRRLHTTWMDPESRERARAGGRSHRYRALAVASLGWLVCVCTFFACLLFPMMYSLEEDAGNMVYVAAIQAALFALIPAAALFWAAQNRGLAACGRLVWAAGLSAAAPMLSYCLWITYTRGAMLALAVALAGTAVLYFLRGERLPRFFRRWAIVCVCVAAVGAFAAAAATSRTGWAAPEDGPAAVHTEKANAQQAAEPQPTKHKAPQEPRPKITEEGLEVGLSDLTNTASLGLRFSYWKVGLTMFRHHVWTGVGLGNFGLAYPMYQYFGAGDVREAHNGFLQAFCETGVLGGLLLVCFWGYFAIWGAFRILREQNRGERLLLAGLYAGLLAFLLHSCLDINFSHSTLMMFAIVFLALFYARADTAAASDKGTSPKTGYAVRGIGIGLLVVLALGAGLSLRPYLQDLAISRVQFRDVADRDNLRHRIRAADFLLTKVQYAGANHKGRRMEVSLLGLMPLIPDLQQLAELGAVRAKMAGTSGTRTLQPGDPIPQDATLTIRKHWKAYHRGAVAAVSWVSELEDIDSRFPCTPELALHIAEWCTLLTETLHSDRHAERRRLYSEKLERWSEEAVRRSPLHADMRLHHGQNLWYLGDLAEGEDKLRFYKRALAEFKRASQLAATTPAHTTRYAYALKAMGKYYREQGVPGEADYYAGQAKRVHGEAKKIWEERRRTGMV